MIYALLHGKNLLLVEEAPNFPEACWVLFQRLGPRIADYDSTKFSVVPV